MFGRRLRDIQKADDGCNDMDTDKVENLNVMIAHLMRCDEDLAPLLPMDAHG